MAAHITLTNGERVEIPAELDSRGNPATEPWVREQHAQRGLLGAYLTNQARAEAYRTARLAGKTVEEAHAAMDAVRPVTVTEQPPVGPAAPAEG